MYCILVTGIPAAGKSTMAKIMYHVAGQLMKTGQPFILENNFEYSSEHGMKNLLKNINTPH